MAALPASEKSHDAYTTLSSLAPCPGTKLLISVWTPAIEQYDPVKEDIFFDIASNLITQKLVT